MTHNPEQCQYCRWLAKRLGLEWRHEKFRAIDPLSDAYWILPIDSFCTSIAAVTGLLRELCQKGWSLFWSESRNKWCMWTIDDEDSPIYSETNDENDYSCIIKTAMQTLEEESDG